MMPVVCRVALRAQDAVECMSWPAEVLPVFPAPATGCPLSCSTSSCMCVCVVFVSAAQGVFLQHQCQQPDQQMDRRGREDGKWPSCFAPGLRDTTATAGMIPLHSNASAPKCCCCSQSWLMLVCMLLLLLLVMLLCMYAGKDPVCCCWRDAAQCHLHRRN